MSPEGYAQFEYHKMQLIGSLNQFANKMRECAADADQFAHIVGSFPYNANPPAFPQLGNGQQFPMAVGPPSSVPAEESGKKRKSRVVDPEGKRKQKKIKDPNAPKRPASSYLLFQNDIRRELKAKNPAMKNNDLLVTIARLWAEMPQEQKDVYEARNKVAKQEWMDKKTVYETHKAEGSGVPAPTSPIAPYVKPILPPAAIAAEITPSEESTGEDDESSEEETTDEEAVPAPKKSKKEGGVVAPSKEEMKKEKKHKKSKD